MKSHLIAGAMVLTSCSLFTKENARSANDVARDLCRLHAEQIKPGISAEEIANGFCKDVQPWLDFVLATQRVGLPAPAEDKPAP